jgi:hypothetical protein
VSPGCVRRPAGVEPGQRPEFEQITVVLRGMLRVEYEGGILDVPRRAGTAAREWIRYRTPEANGAEYMAVCVSPFALETVHRDSA